VACMAQEHRSVGTPTYSQCAPSSVSEALAVVCSGARTPLRARLVCIRRARRTPLRRPDCFFGVRNAAATVTCVVPSCEIPPAEA